MTKRTGFGAATATASLTKLNNEDQVNDGPTGGPPGASGKEQSDIVSAAPQNLG
jgi:hypothetical protein